MTRFRLELLQWYALLGGAVAWAAQQVTGYFVSTAGCGSAAVDMRPVQIGLAIAAGAVIAGAEVAALVVFRATADGPPPSGRLRFFARAAILGNVLFLVIVVLTGVGSVDQLPCAPS